MGGKNHQPCNKHLRNSTMMSKCLSQARSELELGNVALEDAILSELSGNPVGLAEVSVKLRASRSSLEGGLEAFAALRKQMDDIDFVDLQTLRTTDLNALGDRLIAKGIVEERGWKTVADIMRNQGFYGVLAFFDERVCELIKKTTTLETEINLLSPLAKKGELCQIVEENRPGNIKVVFADLYTSWSIFEQDFLASSMLSTELWYAASGRQSLVESKIELLAS